MSLSKHITIECRNTANIIGSYANITMTIGNTSYVANSSEIKSFDVTISDPSTITLSNEVLKYNNYDIVMFSKYYATDNTTEYFNLLQDTNATASFEVTAETGDNISIIVSFESIMPQRTVKALPYTFTEDRDIGIYSRGNVYGSTYISWPTGENDPVLQAIALQGIVDNGKNEHNYAFRRWYTSYQDDTVVDSFSDTVNIIKNPFSETTNTTCPNADINFFAIFSNVNTLNSAWQIMNDVGYIGSNLPISISPAIYQPNSGAKLKFKLKVFDSSQSGSGAIYGEETADTNSLSYKLWQAWNTESIIHATSNNIQLPLINELSELLITGSPTIQVGLLLSVDLTETSTPKNATSDKPFIDFDILPENSYRVFSLSANRSIETITISPSAPTYTNTFMGRYPIAGLSSFKGACNVTDSSYNISSVDISYNGLKYDQYKNDYTFTGSNKSESFSYGNYEIDSELTKIPPTSSTYTSNIKISATNSIGVSKSTTYNTGTIYGWSAPSYEILNLIRCNSLKQVDANQENNTCLYIKIKTRVSEIRPSQENLNTLRIPTIEIEDKTKSFTQVDNTTYEVLVENLNPLLNYITTIKLCDEILGTIGTGPVSYKFSLASIVPLSLIQNAGGTGVGLGSEANVDSVTIGLDTVFSTNSMLSASKSNAALANGIESKSVDSFSLLKRGGDNSVSISDSDLASGSYINTIKIISRTEYANLKDSQKDSHTMYIIVR